MCRVGGLHHLAPPPPPLSVYEHCMQLILAQFLHRLSQAKTLQPIQSSRMVVYPSKRKRQGGVVCGGVCYRTAECLSPVLPSAHLHCCPARLSPSAGPLAGPGHPGVLPQQAAALPLPLLTCPLCGAEEGAGPSWEGGQGAAHSNQSDHPTEEGWGLSSASRHSQPCKEAG